MQTLVRPSPMRSTISQEAGELRICIPCLRKWTVLVFFSVWLPLWTYGGLEVGQKVARQFDLFSFFWMCFWVFSEARVIYIVLRMLFGRDIAIVTAGTFSVRKELFGFGRTNTYIVSEMRDLRFQPEASRIAFDYGAKTLAFAEEIQEAEANELIRLIGSRCKISPALGPEPGIKFWQHD
jgi:hypothetical protein